MDLTTASDETLIQGFERNDIPALEEFYDRHHRLALAVAYRVLGDRQMAEDVVQEAFLAVWRQADTFRPDRGGGRLWFLSIVRHRAIDVTRGRAFARERLSLDEMYFEPRDPDVWQQVSHRLDRERIREALDDLPAEQRDAITLSYFGGFTHQEISIRMEVPLGTVKGRMRLAMQKLRSLLADIDTGGPH